MVRINKNSGTSSPNVFGRIPLWRNGLNKKLFSIILVQSLIGISMGVAVAYTVGKDTVPGRTCIAAVNVGGLSAGEAENRLKGRLDIWLKEGTLKISVDEANTYEVGYRDLGMTVKLDETMRKVLGKENPGDSLANFISGELAGRERLLNPVFAVDLQLLREELSRLAPALERDPVNASVSLSGGKVKKAPEANGRKLNVEKAVDTVIKQLSSHLMEPVEFRLAAGLELEPSKPEYTLDALEGVDHVIASYATDIESDEFLDSIHLAVEAINQSIIPFNTGSSRDTFSFTAKLKNLEALQETDNEGYNQVASTLYAAALTAGIDPNRIIRTPHSTTVEYIQPGLDARVFGDALDLQFQNTTGGPLVVLAEVQNGKVQISLIGKTSGQQEQNRLKVEVKAKTKPPIIKVPNDQLDPGMEREISPGREGMEVQVSRIRTGDDGKAETETIGKDSYRAVEAIVEFGPDYSGGIGIQK